MTDSGFVLLHRSLLGHPAFRNESETMAFAWMVARASWQPARVRYKGFSISLARGELCISQRDMAEAFGRDKAWIERLWKRLGNEAMIEARVEAAATVITICNYARYQDNRANREAADEAAIEADVRQRRGTEQRREQGNNLSDAKASSPRERPKPKPKPVSTFELPGWIPGEAWAAYEEMRNTKPKPAPMTDRARGMVVKRLAELRDAGQPPGKVLDQSTRSQWTDVYELKGNNNGHSHNGNRPNRSNDGFLNALDEAARNLSSDDARGG